MGDEWLTAPSGAGGDQLPPADGGDAAPVDGETGAGNIAGAPAAGVEGDTAAGRTEEETAGEGEQAAWTEIPWVRTALGEDPVHGLYLGAAGLFLGAALAIAVGAAVRRARRRKSGEKRGTAGGPPDPGSITVEKLHEQGARKNQQDCFAVSPLEFAGKQGVLAVVADGMGGLADGDKVSQAAVTAALDGFFTATGTPEQILLDLLDRAVRAVNRALGPDGMRAGGTTLVMGLLKDGMFHYLSVGDSRICLYRDGTLYQLNREHVYRNELAVRAVNGEISLRDVYTHPKAGGLTSYLGMGDLRYVDLPAQPVAVRAGDRFVLMCDGVYNALSERELAEALAAEDGAEALRSAIRKKNYANQDNYTAVILKC